MTNASVTLNDFKGILNYAIDNNRKLQEENPEFVPIALNLVGEKGVGKTSILRQVAKDRGMKFVKLNVAQLDEVGD